MDQMAIDSTGVTLERNPNILLWFGGLFLQVVASNFSFHLRQWIVKADAAKTSHCLVWILVQRHNWLILENEQGEAVTVNGIRYRTMLNEFLFTKIEEENIGNIWFQQAEATLDGLRFVFEDRIISRRADVVWSPRSCDLTPLDYYLCFAVKDKCCADKP